MAAWTDLGGGIRVRQSRAWRMNSVALLDPLHGVLVDPGVLPSELDEIAMAVTAVHPARTSVLLTHGHWDHVVGRIWWPSAPVMAHAGLGEEIRRDSGAILRAAMSYGEEAGEPWDVGFDPFTPDLALLGERPLVLGPWRFLVREAFGHCDSQVSLHLFERRLLIAADMLSDIEIPILNRPPEVYRRTLEELRGVAEAGEIEILIPGHGSIARGADDVRARIRRDLDYLERLEEAVRAARARGLSLEETRVEVGAMEYPGRAADGSTTDDHRRNIQFAWEGTDAHASHR